MCYVSTVLSTKRNDMTNQHATQKANLLFSLLDNIPLEGQEASFKMSYQLFLKIRFLIGIRTDHIHWHHLESICRQMDMPDACLTPFKTRLSDANVVLFGFEESPTHCIYKVYLEFLETNNSIIKENICKRPLIQYIGFKWDAFNNKQYVITTYHWFPFISKNDMFERLECLFSKESNPDKVWVIKNIIQMSINGINHAPRPYIYLEATDETGRRQSFDINLYHARLTIAQLHPFIHQIMEAYNIDKKTWQAFLRQIENKTFGHISGGYSNQGEDFLTVYYEI